MADQTSTKKGRGFGDIAKQTLEKSGRPTSMQDFLSDGSQKGQGSKPEVESKSTKPETGGLTGAGTQKDRDEIQTVSKTTPPKKAAAKTANKIADLKDRRTVYFSETGSDNLDYLELVGKKMVGPGLKSKVSTSLIIDLAIQVCYEQYENKGEKSPFAEKIRQVISSQG